MRLLLTPLLALVLVLALCATTRMVTTFPGLLVLGALLIGLLAYALFRNMNHSKGAPSKRKMSFVLKGGFTLAFLLIVGLSFAGRRTFMGFDVLRMAVPAMQPTLLPGERFIVDTRAFQHRLPQRGDVVVHSFTRQAGLYVNRVVAIGGDRIEIAKGQLLINGNPLPEPYVSATNKVRAESITLQPMVVPEGHYFVLGDNRDASFGDSRFSGCITGKQVVAKVTDVISSPHFSRVGARVQ